MEVRALHMLSTCSTTEPHPSPLLWVFKVSIISEWEFIVTCCKERYLIGNLGKGFKDWTPGCRMTVTSVRPL